MILRRASDPFPPTEAAGKRIGVRSYSQTTGIWVRAILRETYGVDPAAIQWMCTEDAHVAEYMDPPNVTRMAVPASQLADLLLDGTLDAAIFGADLPTDNSEVVPLIADPHAAAQQWYAAHGYVPVNHMLAVTRELATRHPDVVRRIYRLFAEARKAAPESSDGIDYLPIGFDALRAPVEAMIAHAFEQNIIPRKLTFAEVFEDAQRLLEG
jgi:4,5-dihydroxyphthalate decarboxylase